jgi:hypothetical protein
MSAIRHPAQAGRWPLKVDAIPMNAVEKTAGWQRSATARRKEETQVSEDIATAHNPKALVYGFIVYLPLLGKLALMRLRAV